jgi:hypothetical protein
MGPPEASFYEAASTQYTLDGLAALGLAPGASRADPISLAAGDSPVPEPTVAIRSAPLYELHSTLLI